MALAYSAHRGKRNVLILCGDCHPQTLAVVHTRAWPLGIEVQVEPFDRLKQALEENKGDDGTSQVCAVVIQYPATDGAIRDPRPLAEAVHEDGALVIAACDLLSLCLLEAPGSWGADVAVGSTQRFGVPMGWGGPHAAFLATREKYRRLVPGRIVGVSKDQDGRPALRLALQTREQHIRRDRATSNICTAQVLPAVLASMYAVYHGPSGLHSIASRVHEMSKRLAESLLQLGFTLRHDEFFDTLRIETEDQEQASAIAKAASEAGMNLRLYEDNSLGVALDETVSSVDLEALLAVFSEIKEQPVAALATTTKERLPEGLKRTTTYLSHPVFSSYHSETELLRYLQRLESRDLALDVSMIPLGSCTMKLNATAEMEPVTWPEFASLHPFAPAEQAVGYRQLCGDLERWLAEITGFEAISLQPNAGSQGELAGLLTIRQFHRSRGETNRTVCLIPTSAHGTNPASAVMAGMRVIAVACDDRGNIDVADLEARAAEHADELAALMVTYPSTHGVFEASIQSICETVHKHGGQVYMDGANMNAQVGLCRPGDFGADVCHLNLHKTFCIPHGGGGPGMGPIGVAEHLVRFCPATHSRARSGKWPRTMAA